MTERTTSGGPRHELRSLPLIRDPFPRFAFTVCATILTIACAAPARANHVHMHGGPFIGVVLAVAVDPAMTKTLYVAAHGGGVFRSKDGGASWLAINQGLPDRQVFSFLIHPGRSRNLYVGTDQGIFKSTDQGATWRSFSPVIKERNIRALVTDLRDSELLYAATDQGVFSGRNNQWQHLSAGLGNNDVRALAVDAQGTIFAGTFGGVYKKQKSESQWQAVHAGLSDKRVRALVLDPSEPGKMYAGAATGGVFKSSNGGKSWREFNRGLLNSTVLSLLRVPVPEQSFYAGTVDGIFKSRNGQNQWVSIGPDLPFTVSAIAFDPGNPRRLYAGSGGRLYRSDDAGKTWQEVSHQINYFGTVSLDIKQKKGGEKHEHQ